jgi:hypothetical protein
VGGGGDVYAQMIRRAEAVVDESAHQALVNAGERDIVGKQDGEKEGSA